MARLMELLRCLRCGHEWLPRVMNPVRCPSCMSPLWNKARTPKPEVAR